MNNEKSPKRAKNQRQSQKTAEARGYHANGHNIKPEGQRSSHRSGLGVFVDCSGCEFCSVQRRSQFCLRWANLHEAAARLATTAAEIVHFGWSLVCARRLGIYQTRGEGQDAQRQQLAIVRLSSRRCGSQMWKVLFHQGAIYQQK